VVIEERKQRLDIQKQKLEEERQRKREEEKRHKEEEKRRKAHNTTLRDQINKLVKKKEKLQLESYAKARALANPRIYRDENTAREYGQRLKEIEKIIAQIDLEIKLLEKQII
jgi:hypothetical protein